MKRALATLALSALAVAARDLPAQTLKGSPDSMVRQNAEAKDLDFTFLRTPRQVRAFAREGVLVRVSPTSDMALAGVSYPYARPEVKLFVERLATRYREACGERLVVTSLTRPLTRQPRNAHKLSVHPAGMAADLRRSRRAACRTWIEQTLLDLENQGVLDATKESRPAHYHVAVFPREYEAFVDAGEDDSGDDAAADSAPPGALVLAEARASYTVQPGDSLWSIAQRHGVSVEILKRANQLRAPRTDPAQVVVFPGSGR